MESLKKYAEELVARNQLFSLSRFDPALTMLPKSRTIIIGCLDPRVDPGEIFQLAPGEVAIYRNIGGRVNAALIESLTLLRTVSKGAGGNPMMPPTIIVLHHTDCGIKHAHLGAAELLAHHLGVAVHNLDQLEVDDPYQSVLIDTAALKAHPLTASSVVTGMVYDVSTGLVELVVPPY